MAQSAHPVSMRAFVAACLVLAGAIASDTASVARAQEATAGAWREFAPDGANYKIAVLGEPKVEAVENVGDDGTPIVSKVYPFTVGGLEFMSGYTDLPAGMVTPDVVDAALDGAREGAVAEYGGKLRREEKLEINGRRARHIVIDLPDGAVAVGRMVLDGDRLIQAAVMAPKGAENRADILRFLNSLQLTMP